MTLSTIAVVGAGLVHVGAVGVVETLLGVGGDARRTAAACVAWMIIWADRGCGVGITDDGAALVGAAGVARHTSGRIKFFAAAADISFVEEAFEGAFGRAKELTTTRFAAGLPITTTLFRAIRAKDDGILIAFFRRRPGVQGGPCVNYPSIGSASVYGGISRRSVEHNAGVGRRRFGDASAEQRE